MLFTPDFFLTMLNCVRIYAHFSSNVTRTMNVTIALLLDVVSVTLVLGQNNKLTSVSYFPNIEDLYVEVNYQRPTLTRERILTAEAKQALCRSITSGDYFDSPTTTRVEHMEDVYRMFKKKRYRAIFRRIYSKPTRAECFPSFSRYRYVNEYTPRRVTFRNERFKKITSDEDVITCVTVNTETKTMDAWCLSHEYNIGVAARFVFGCSHKKSMELVALAEEGSIVVTNEKTDEAERRYIDVRKKHVPVESTAEDPLCVLVEVEGQHSRLCVAVFASSIFKRTLKYVPPSKEDEHLCHPRPIKFQNEHADVGPSEEYWELMSHCRGFHKHYRDYVDYFVSRAYASERVFVYEFQTRGSSRGYIFLKSLNSNIISISDRGNPMEQGASSSNIDYIDTGDARSEFSVDPQRHS